MPHWPRIDRGLRGPLINHFAALPRGVMATIQNAAPADIMAASASGGRRIMRFIGPLVVLLALLSALATFMVLAGLSPFSASHDVVLRLLAFNAGAVALLLGIIVLEIWPVVQGRRRGRAAACEHRRPVLGDRGGASDPCRPGRQPDARPRRRSPAEGGRRDQRYQHGRKDLRPRAPAGVSRRDPGDGDHGDPREAAVRPGS